MNFEATIECNVFCIYFSAMSFLKNILGKKDEPIRSYADFWNWFQKNEKTFFKSVKNGKSIHEDFLNKLGPALAGIKEGIYYLCGMCDDNTVELIFSAEGSVKNIVFVEDLVSAAPAIDGWKFTPLKPGWGPTTINMDGYSFNKDNLWFYANVEEAYADEIDITIVHSDLNGNNKREINNGVFVFLDNYLGELNFAITVDNLVLATKDEAKEELIPIEKLKDYLVWRQKEFIEKYEGSRYNTENDKHAIMEAKLKGGDPLIALINTELLDWDRKASHPWVMTIEIPYDGSQNNGLPDKETYAWLDEIENEISPQLKDFEGYLYIGRQTSQNVREIYYACKDFRKPSKLAYELQQKYADKVELSYDVFIDKYWSTFSRYSKNQ